MQKENEYDFDDNYGIEFDETGDVTDEEEKRPKGFISKSNEQE